MYNPIGDDTNHEWIEIYNNDSDIDIIGWKFYEENTNHGLTLKNGTSVIKNNSYVIIAEDWITFLLDYPNFNGTVFDSSFSLSNTGEFIAIKNSTTYFINNLTYNNTLIPCNEGESIQLINGTWYAASPTPGYENILLNITNKTQDQTNLSNNIDIELTVKLNDIINILQEYTQLFNIKILNKENCSIKDNITVFYNITNLNNTIKQDYFSREIGCSGYANTGSIIFNETGNYTICGLIINSTVNDTNLNNNFICENRLVIDTRTIPCNISISISTDKIIYNNSEQIKFYNILNNESFLYKIEYWIEDLFNYIIKDKINTTNTNQKSYTPSIEESDQVFIIKNKIVELYCNNTNQNIASEKLIVIKGKKDKESTVNITNIYLGSDNKIKFGESLRVRINIYKGDETKNNVKLWLEKDDEKISKVTSTNLYTNFINYDLTLAVQIEPNCNEKYHDGYYTLFLIAFDKNDSAIVPISGITTSNCKTTTKYVSGGSLEKQVESSLYEIISIPLEVNLNQEFISKIRLNNNENEEHKYSIWSYIYRGNKAYGEREENMQELTIPSKSSAIIELKNIPIEEGDFNFKIKIRKDEQKTTKDITKTIKVISLKELKKEEELETNIKIEKEKELLQKKDIGKNIFLSEKEPKAIYLSSSFKARKLASFFIIFLISFLLISIIWKKTI